MSARAQGVKMPKDVSVDEAQELQHLLARADSDT